MAIQATRNDDDMDQPIASTADRSFLGGISSGARTWLFFLACAVAAVAFGGLFYYADQRLDEAISEMQRGSRIDELAIQTLDLEIQVNRNMYGHLCGRAH